MRFGKMIVPAVTVILAGCQTAPDNPFVGEWMLNPAKSQFSGDTVNYEAAEDDIITATVSGQSYTFKVDGQEHAALFGQTEVWKQTDERSWEILNRHKGEVLATQTLRLSPDGKTMTWSAEGVKPNGESFEDTGSYERVAGTDGLLGTWRSTEVKIGSPGEMHIAPYEGDGLTWSSPDYKYTCSGKLDGEEIPCFGPTIPDGLTLSMTRTGERTLTSQVKDNGRPVFNDQWSVSEDGTTLTIISRPVGADEPMTAVYDRQP